MAMGTLCLCIIMVVSIAMIGVYLDKIHLDSFGTVTKAGLGTGILGMTGLLVFAVKGIARGA